MTDPDAPRQARPRWRIAHRTVSAALAAGMTILALSGGAPLANAAGAPFDPGVSMVLLAQGEHTASCSGTGNNSTQLFEGVQTFSNGTVSVVYTAVGAPSCTQYNAIGFDSNDNYVYGVVSTGASEGHLVRVAMDGTITDLGAVGLPAPSTGNPYTIGAYVPASGTSPASLVVAVGQGNGATSGTTQICSIPLSGGGPTTPDSAGKAVCRTTTNLPNIADWVYLDGYLWGFYTNQGNPPVQGTNPLRLYRIDPATGAVTFAALPTSGPNSFTGKGMSSFGGQWLYGNGNIGLSDNINGMIYQVEFFTDNTFTTPYTGGTAMPVVKIISGIAGLTTDGQQMKSTGNDATSTPGGPVDLGIVKLVSVDGTNYSSTAKFDPAGQTVTYTITVTNELSNAAAAVATNMSNGWILTDPIPAGLTLDPLGPATVTYGGANHGNAVASCQLASDQVTCAATPGMLPGDTITITLTGTASGGNPIVNTATVLGNDPDPGSAPNTSTATLTPLSLNLLKTANPTSITAPGDITYSYVISNDGEATAYGVTLSSDVVVTTNADGSTNAPGSPVDLTQLTCQVSQIGQDPANPSSLGAVGDAASGVLASPGVTMVADDQITCTFVRHVTQADLDTGFKALDNTATVDSFKDAALTDPGTPLTYSANVTTDLKPKLTLDKSAVPMQVASPGDAVNYSFLVTNTGNVAVSGIAIDETSFSGSPALTVTCPTDVAAWMSSGVVGRLEPNDHVTCTATYSAALADIAAGSITNTATATGTGPGGAAVVSDPDSVTITVPPPAFTFTKKLDPADVVPATVGEVLIYDFVVTNTGGVALTNVTIDDPLPGVSAVTCPATRTAGQLSIGESITCTATYTVTATDQANQTLVNTATASATPPNGVPLTQTSAVPVVILQPGQPVPPAQPAAPPAPAAQPAAPTGGVVVPRPNPLAPAAALLLFGAGLAILPLRHGLVSGRN